MSEDQNNPIEATLSMPAVAEENPDTGAGGSEPVQTAAPQVETPPQPIYDQAQQAQMQQAAAVPPAPPVQAAPQPPPSHQQVYAQQPPVQQVAPAPPPPPPPVQMASPPQQTVYGQMQPMQPMAQPTQQPVQPSYPYPQQPQPVYQQQPNYQAQPGYGQQQTYQPQPQLSYQQPQPVYQQQAPQAVYNNPVAVSLTAPLKVSQYVGMFLLSMIPLVNIVLYFIWAFSSNVNTNKQNYARAVLLLMLIFGVLGILFSVVFGGLMAAIMSSQGRSF